MLTKKKLWRTLAVTFLTLGIICLVGGEVAGAYASAINYALKTDSYKVVVTEDDAVSTDYYPSDYPSSEAVAAHGREISELAEGEGMVLLKNRDGALPLAKGSAISPALQTAYSFSYGSSGSGAIDASKYIDLKTALTAAGFTVNSTLWDYYVANPSTQAITYNRKGDAVYKVNAIAWDSYSDEAKASVSVTGGTALAVIGRLGGEGADVSTKKSDGYDGSYLSLSAEEISVLSALTELKKAGAIERIVVLINTAFPFETSFLADDWTVEAGGTAYTVDVDACLWVGNVGIGGMQAIAKALTGEVNPSGHLADTYVKDNFSAPATAAWVLQNDNGGFASKYENSGILSSDSMVKYGVYTEGIYVGYRYYETRYEDVVTGRANVGNYDYSAVVARPFGYGLSYTTFAWKDYCVTENADGSYTAAVTVTNTGDTAGKDVVQVYLQKPYTDYDMENGVEKASVELAGFEKTNLLAPGESQTLTITVERDSFKTYDANGYRTYIVEPGDYYLAIGANAHDALNNILAAKGYTQADGMDDAGDAAFARPIGQNLTLDTTTFAVSAVTGEAITNRLDFADINKYEGRGDNQVTWLTRQDWAGTFPTAAVTLTATEQMAEDLKSIRAIREDLDAVMPTYGAQNGLSLIMLRGEEKDSDLWQDLLDQMTWEEQTTLVMLAGYGTFGATSISLPEIKGEDGPTGVVSSADNISFPSEGIWAASFNREVSRLVGDAIAEDARNVGVTAMYLPGINIHRSAFGGRAHEYFSEDPYLTAEAVTQEVQGLQAKGVIPYVKHYVFNDEEDSRIGIGIWLNEQSAREIYLKPFEAAVSPARGHTLGLMSSFNRAGCVWTSASHALMEDILRGEFGFEGVVLTDMALGQNAYMSYDAIVEGTDLFLDPTGAQSQFDSYAQSNTFRQAVRQAVQRYLYVVANGSAAMNGLAANSTIVPVTPWWQALITGLQIAFFALGGAAAVMLALCLRREMKQA